MNGELKLGAILHHKDFEFQDGSKKNKYLVVLGAQPDYDYLCVLTTSQQGKRGSERGCHHKPHTYFFIPADGKNSFLRNTWLLLSSPVIISKAEMIKKGIENIIQTKDNLKQPLIGEIRNCLKASRDISKKQMQLL